MTTHGQRRTPPLVREVEKAIAFLWMFSVILAAVPSAAVAELSKDVPGATGLRKRVVKRDVKRSGRLSSTDMVSIVNQHNKYREDQHAANMEYMKWNQGLADMAQEWADQCKFAHGHLEVGNKPYEAIGQNIWHGSKFTVDEALASWYNERRFYNHKFLNCSGICQHYTQLVWGASKDIGCALSNCHNKSQIAIKEPYLLVCNYGPAGNYKDEKPFIKGDPCTKCPSGIGECYKGLCRDVTTDKIPGVCRVKCFNCGTINTQNCTCSCPVGWDDTDCSRKCEDKSSKCISYKRDYCAQNSKFFPYMKLNCRSFCGLCSAATGYSKHCDPVQANYTINNVPVETRIRSSCGQDEASCTGGASHVKSFSVAAVVLQTSLVLYLADALHRR